MSLNNMKKIELFGLFLMCFNIILSGAILGMHTAIPDTNIPEISYTVDELKELFLNNSNEHLNHKIMMEKPYGI